MLKNRGRSAAVGMAVVAASLLGAVQTAGAAPAGGVSAAADADHGSSGQGPVTPVTGSASDSRAAAVASPAITRDEVIRRAKSWVGIGLDYNQSGYYQGWRTDCSGYVSMAWNLGSSLTTNTFIPEDVAEWSTKDSLKTGDVLLNEASGSSGHVALFDSWTDSTHTEYMGYEFTGSGVHYRPIPYPYFSGYGTFKPARLKSIVGETSRPAGRVWDRSRPDGGPWDATADLIDAGGAVNAVSASGLPNGTMHVQALVNGEIWDRTRAANGTWGASSKIDANGNISDVASAGLPDGTLHVQALVNGEIWDRTRAANGTWGNSTKIDAGGAITDIASTALADGTLHVQAVVNGEIWNRTRAANGTWGGSSRIDAGGAITDLSSAAGADGTLHVQALVNGEIWDRARAANGTWGGSTKIDAGGAVKQLSSVGLPNGDIHVQAVVNGDVWDRVLKGTTGNWSVSSLIDNNGAIFDTYAAATPNGTLHVGTNA
ncbi:hypothetical protein ACWD3I_09910 [Streptomyces sp. NPDC002817]|uniref:hypothetical protein n=1 Tax=Streptomyces sp. NPDC088357 TaxID=3154655 RepID=UPI00341CE7DB